MISHHPRRSLQQDVPAIGLALALVLASGAAIADGGAEHRALQTRPSVLGVSGSSIEFIDIGGTLYCYTGTLGAVVEDVANPAILYVLSNNHVLARENVGAIGEPIIQPGLLDENGDPASCSEAETDYSPLIVAHLSDFVPLNLKVLPFGKPNNVVDAAIAEIVAGEIDSLGEIRDIGTLNPATAPAEVGQAVQKSGRTTGLTHGTVEAVDVSIAVQYDHGFGLFKNQIRVRGVDGTDFILPGDSGSLMVTDEVVPQAVGLLFAGGDVDAFANPIDEVNAALAVAMVGCADDPDCSAGGGGGGGGKGGGNGGGNGGGKPKTASLPPGLQVASEAKASHEEALFENPSVVGTGVSLDEHGNPVIEVYTKRARRSAEHVIPDFIEGIPVRVIETGEIRAY